MNNEYRFQLESRKLTGRNPQKIACPECHKKKCFVRYVDTHNNYCYLSDEVGKCDHQHSCGYHYKPLEYFKKELKEVKTAHSQIPVFVRKQKHRLFKPKKHCSTITITLTITVFRVQEFNNLFFRFRRNRCFCSQSM